MRKFCFQNIYNLQFFIQIINFLFTKIDKQLSLTKNNYNKQQIYLMLLILVAISRRFIIKHILAFWQITYIAKSPKRII